MRNFILLLVGFVLYSLPVDEVSAVEPFFAPSEAAGTVQVRLHPTEGLATGVPRIVTFGVPFTRGSVTPAQVANLRVLRGGIEIPAHVMLLTPWRHATNLAIDGASARIVRVQIEHTFAASFPAFETVDVQWGGPARKLERPDFVDPRSAWHPVTSGSFVSPDGVAEPDVFAVLPAETLVKGVMRGARMSRTSPSMPETRDDPAAMDAILRWPAQQESERAHKNNFYSVINQDDPLVAPANQCPYKVDFEPWLFDRASTMFVLHFRSGSFKALREAVRNAEFYRTRLWPAGTLPARAVGAFRLKNPVAGDYIGSNGAMYSYAESLAYTHWLTGDPLAATAIPWVVNAQEANADASTRWSLTSPTWTERHNGLRLLANTIAYEVTNDAAAKARMLAQSGDFRWHQDGAPDAGGIPQIPASRLDGALYHFGSQHGDGTANALVASSWMSVILGDAMIRVYSLTESIDNANFIRRLGAWQSAVLSRGGDSLYGAGPFWYSHYMLALNGDPDPADGDEVSEHSLAITASIAWGAYFAELTATPDASLWQAARDVYETYDEGVNYWIRPAGPTSGFTAFRVTPWRKWSWEHRMSGSLPWLMAQNDSLFGNGFE